jgi:hypothetical protein
MRASEPGVPIIRFSLSNIFVEILQVAPNGDHELISVSAVDDSMVVAQSQPDNVTDGDGVASNLIRDHHPFF